VFVRRKKNKLFKYLLPAIAADVIAVWSVRPSVVKFVARDEMPFGSDTRVITSNIVRRIICRIRFHYYAVTAVVLRHHIVSMHDE